MEITKQERLNNFIIEFAEFIEKYYSIEIDEISNEDNNEWIIQRIVGTNDSIIEIWTEGSEITIIFGETHWHIDDYNDPCDLNEIYVKTIDSVLSILRGEVCTASYWFDDCVKGGETLSEDELKSKLSDKKYFFGEFNKIKFKKWAEEIKIIKW